MATGTVIPWLTEQFEDANGTPLNGGFVFTYLAGTTTPVTTYTDVGLTTPHANPIVLNSSGRPSSGGSDVPIYLTPGVSYKFLIQNSASVTIVTRDNISAIPASTQGLDIVGTVGENITANQAVYLSDGSGGKTQGQWYRADTTNDYSSTTNEVGIALAAITSGTSGTIRLAGSTPGFSALTIGSLYYLSSTPGTLSVTPDATQRRLVGQADSATSMVVFGGAPVTAIYSTGTWTPTIAGSTGTSGQTYSQQIGTYIKIGKFVTAQFRVDLSVKGTINGTVQISGLPFANNTTVQSVSTLVWISLATNWVSVVGLLGASGAVLNIQGATAAATTNSTSLVTADIANNTAFAGTISYTATA